MRFETSSQASIFVNYSGKAQSNPDEEDFTFIDDEASKQDQSLNNSSRNTAEGSTLLLRILTPFSNMSSSHS